MLAYVFVLVAIAFRFVPHPLNFTPLAASLLYFGARQPRKRMWIPLVLLAAADVALTVHTYGYPFKADTLVTWGFYAVALWFGSMLRHDSRALRIGATSIAASVVFYVVSNFAVWATWDMYPKTLSGLATCYAMALPFFRNGIAGDLIFAAVFFGVGALVSAHEAEAKGIAA